MVPDIAENAMWETNAHTVAGFRGPGPTFHRLHCPKGLYVDHNQTILIADSSNHRILKYSPGATSGQRIAGKNINGYGLDRLFEPSDVIFGNRLNSFIIADYHNRRVLQWCHGRSTYSEVIIQNVACCGLAVDDEGSLYVSDTELHEVRRYRAGDRYGTVVAGGHGQGTRPNQLSHPTYIFVGRDQAVYVSDSWNDRVMRWDKGAKVGVIVAGGNGKGKDRKQLDNPAGVLVDRSGTVYVADHYNGRVMRWRNGAKQGEIIAGDKFLSGDYSNQLNGPEGLAFDRYNNLYVADSNNHRIQRFYIQRT